MSRQEASWHEHIAGMRAAEEARKAGGDPAAYEAFATAVAGPVTIGAFTLHPASEGTVWTLRRVAREFQVWADANGLAVAGTNEPDGERELIEMGLSVLVFCDSLRVWRALDARDLEGLIFEARQLVWGVPVEVYRALEAHFQEQMDAIRRLSDPSGAPPKKQTTAGGCGVSPATQTQPGDTL